LGNSSRAVIPVGHKSKMAAYLLAASFYVRV
jgi:hypothetical protein